MLEVRGLECLRGGRRLFGDLTFKVCPGELLHVQGTNGSGKTSLLRILAGLSRPDDGEVLWQTAGIGESGDEYVSKLLYLGHHPAVKDDLTVIENLLISSRIAALDPAHEEFRSALEKTGLGKHTGLPARVLSQGQRRRLALARLWLDDKPLWILDEPFTALDVQATALLEGRLGEHLTRGGMVVLTTHQRPDIDEARLRVLRLA
jgi:heme exporter protein A